MVSPTPLEREPEPGRSPQGRSWSLSIEWSYRRRRRKGSLFVPCRPWGSPHRAATSEGWEGPERPRGSSSSPSRPQRLSKEVQNALARASNTAEETISALKTVRSFANEEAEAEVYSRKLQQVYKLNRKEAAAYTYYVWGSGVRAPAGRPPVGGGV